MFGWNVKSWGRLSDANVNSPEWNAFVAKVGANPSAELVSSFSLVNQDPSNMANDFTDAGQVVNANRMKTDNRKERRRTLGKEREGMKGE